MQLPIAPSSSLDPMTEEDFERAIADARIYKEACTAAENAAEEESRRRFSEYQQMYFVEKAIQERTAHAHANLHELLARARKAGFSDLSPSPERDMSEDSGTRRLSQDTIRAFINRLEKPEWEF